MNLIHGEKFKKILGSNVYYVDTPNANNFLKSPPKEPFVLISHNSDGKVLDYDTQFGANINYIPDNIIKWYAQNVCVKHPKLESIPIGLENKIWYPHLNKGEKILKKSKEEKKYKNLLYISHNIKTNPLERTEPYEIFKNEFWVTINYGVNGINFDDYLHNLHSHKFVLCPEGNGTDTHRTWETLYVGSIPIEKRNLNNIFYIDLPICFVDKWSDITEEFLNQEYERINSKKWNLQKLDFNYWISKIKNNL